MTETGNLVLILGLAGSGKSHLVPLLKCDFLIEEDFANGSERERQNIQTLIDNLKGGKTCVVSERKYLAEGPRNDFLECVNVGTGGKHKVAFICFENDLETANSNCRNRGSKRGDVDGSAHVAQNKTDSQDYAIPDGAHILKIHKVPFIAPPSPPICTPPEISLSAVMAKQ